MLAKPTLQAVIMELNGSGDRYGFDEARILTLMNQFGFRTYSYDPFTRTLKNLHGKNLSSGNTLFIRDEDVVARRLKLAPHVLVHGEPLAVDLGEAGGRPFLGIASLGFDSSANEIANAAPRRLGRGIYVYGALLAIARWKPATFTIELDGGERRFEGWSVIVANTSVYGAGMFVAPDARLDDGLLDVVTISRSSRLKFAATLPKVFKGTHVSDGLVTVERAREVRISASRPFDVYADGDPIAALPTVIRALPGAVRVLLPAS